MAEKTKQGKLFMVATPIGNLQDITMRAVETLKNVDAVFAEDTRVTSKLLAYFKIAKPIFRYDEHSHEAASAKLIAMLNEGKQIALTTDAGTPGIADPGSRLVSKLVEMYPEAVIIPIPGASAVSTLLSVSGMNTEQYTFLGYPPHKKGRKTFFENLKKIEVWPVVLYESPHRIEKALLSIKEVLGDDCSVVVGRELTKVHEEIVRGSAKTALAYFTGKEKARGEFVLAIGLGLGGSPRE